MLRDKNLVPLSRQHQHALALCVRLDRAIQAGEINLESWQAEIVQIFEQEIAIHFAAEEKHVFPTAAKFTELQPVVQELLREHVLLRDAFARAHVRGLDRAALSSFAATLPQHIRKEERHLFEGMQQVMSAEQLHTLGVALERALKDAAQTCVLPGDTGRQRPK
jgi:hemerythrin-like domain-containing protein